MSEGYLMIDHRASPGIPEAMARSRGLPPAGVREGALLEMATMKCSHCGGVFMKNPERTRPRERCGPCNRYICDNCHAATKQAQYVHRSFEEISDLVRSGRFTVGGDPTAPILIPIQL